MYLMAGLKYILICFRPTDNYLKSYSLYDFVYELNFLTLVVKHNFLCANTMSLILINFKIVFALSNHVFLCFT